MLLKGAAVLRLYYVDYGARLMGDVDPLVHRDGVPDAFEVLAEGGLRPTLNRGLLPSGALLRATHARPHSSILLGAAASTSIGRPLVSRGLRSTKVVSGGNRFPSKCLECTRLRWGRPIFSFTPSCTVRWLEARLRALAGRCGEAPRPRCCAR